MASKNPALPTWLSAGILGVVIGAPLGYYVHFFQTDGIQSSSAPASSAGMASGGRGGGGMGGMMGGMGGPPAPGMTLSRLVRNIGTVEKVQAAGITPAQAKSLLPILDELKSAEKIPEKDAQAKVDAIEKILTEGQKEALQSLTPQRGAGGMGGGMGGGRPAGGPPMSGGPRMSSGGPGGGMGGMMGGMGGQADPEKPFAADRNKQALDDLIAAAQAKAK